MININKTLHTVEIVSTGMVIGLSNIREKTQDQKEAESEKCGVMLCELILVLLTGVTEKGRSYRMI